MSSRKKLKKEINNAFGLLYADCIFYKVYVVDSNQQKANEIIDKIATVHDDILSRMNVTEGKEVKGRVKAYYKNLKDELKEQVDVIGKDIEALS